MKLFVQPHKIFRKFFSISCLLLFCSYASAQVNANFTADSLTGCAPLVVQFTDLSAGNPTSWLWDLGNGSTSTQQNPSTIYFSPGTYTVKLTVSNGAQTNSVTRNQYIVVSENPVVDFIANPLNGCVPLTVQFTDQSSAGSGSAVSWEWDFGDGTTSTDQSPVHQYNVDGDFTITLQVLNSAGCSSIVTKNAFVHVKKKPTASFTTNTSSSCNPPANVAFTSTSSGGTIASALWSFGDGSTSAVANPIHTFVAAGTYNVKLVVINADGCRDSVTRPAVIGEVVADFSVADSICQGAVVTFVNTSSPATASSAWSFGDGTTSASISPVKTYNTSGTFTVKLVNNFGACKDSLTKTIVVLPKPTASFTFSAPPAGCAIPVNVSFASTSAGAVSYLWNFGDGGTATIANPTHSYTANGSYSVKLTIKNANGCTDTILKANIVSIIPVQITGFAGLPFHGCIPYSDTFNATISSPEPVTSYLWNFDDGTTSALANPVHSFPAQGSYDIMLIVKTVSGCTDTFTMNGGVAVYTKPDANFSAAPLITCAYKQVQFTDLSTGSVNYWLWNFGDNESAHDSFPLHHYIDTGYFDVTLIVGNYYCFDSLTLFDYVYIKPPVARFEVKFSCDTPFVRKFIDKSIGAVTYSWDFGDGNTSAVPSPVHTYAATGTYFAKLKVVNDTCYDERADTIYIIDQHPDFTLGSNVLCKNTTSSFTAINIDTNVIIKYTWTFGDLTPVINTTVPNTTHKYTAAGAYSPSLTITDKLGCKRTVTHNLGVRIFGPKAAFSNPAGACVNTPVTFTDLSIADSSYPIVSWNISYGDGTIDSTATPPFTHTYSLVKAYNVTLIVRDSFGCTDTLTKFSVINITSPAANFKVIDTLACVNSPVRFSNLSAGTNLTFTWSFGDNLKSGLRNPTHPYAAEGFYNIKLVVKDKYGCLDSLTKPQAVHIKNPVASFNLSDTLITCPPARINFFNTSTFSPSVSWNFDDGNFSNLDSPIHSFSTAGVYNIKLVAFGYGGCSDTAIRRVTVKGPSGTFSFTTTPSCAPYPVSFVANAINNNNRFTWDFGDGITVTTAASAITHVYTSPGKYIPKLLLRDTILNCTVSIIGGDTVTVTGVESLIKSVPLRYCDSAVVHFFDSSLISFDTVSTYLWKFGDGGTSNLRNPFHTFNAPGIYNVKLVVTTTGGCTDSSAATVIRIVRSPQIILTGSDSACVFLPVTFAASLALPDTSQLQWLWTFSNGDTSRVKNPPAQTYSAAGIYTIKTIVVNSTGCRDTATKLLIVNPLPNVSAGKDTTVCRGDTIMLMPSGAQSYVWQSSPTLSCTSCTNPLASPVDSITYYGITGTSISGCKNTGSVKITVAQPFTISVVAGDTLCQGESFQLSAGNANSFTWFPAAGLSNPNISNPLATPDTTTVYSAVGHDVSNCFTDTATIRVVVYPRPAFNIIPDIVSTSAGNSVTLATTNSPDISSWTWTPVDGLSCTTCPQPVATPQFTTTYTAVVSNGGGCTTQDKVLIQLTCTGSNVYVPNTFSPNNDGMNDVFYPRGKGVNGVKFFHVFNRWGALIYERTNFGINEAQFGWDGKYKGQALSPDVFVYELEVTCANGDLYKLQGNVTLIR